MKIILFFTHWLMFLLGVLSWQLFPLEPCLPVLHKTVNFITYYEGGIQKLYLQFNNTEPVIFQFRDGEKLKEMSEQEFKKRIFK